MLEEGCNFSALVAGNLPVSCLYFFDEIRLRRIFRGRQEEMRWVQM